MYILPVLGYFGLIIGFGFLTLAIASGLYYLSELVEEHTVISKKLLTRLIHLVIAIQTLLWLVDGFPFSLSAVSVASHVVYAANLRRFPFVKLGDPLFVVSCVLVVLNHYLWFRHFSLRTAFPTHNYPANPRSIPSFTDIASYFGICVWLVPFALFVSLSASDNVLPSMGTGAFQDGNTPVQNAFPGIKKSRSRPGLIKAMVDGARGWLGEIGEGMGWKQRRRDL